jgi:hypothetical protein
MQTNPGLKGEWGGMAALPAARVQTGELTGGRLVGEGRIKHLDPRPRVPASLF